MKRPGRGVGKRVRGWSEWKPHHSLCIVRGADSAQARQARRVTHPATEDAASTSARGALGGCTSLQTRWRGFLNPADGLTDGATEGDTKEPAPDKGTDMACQFGKRFVRRWLHGISSAAFVLCATTTRTH